MVSAPKSLRDHLLRIDSRSLGLFRVTFGLVLIADLFARWRWVRDFYANDEVLPNHNHLFNLCGKQQLFSVFHAFSTSRPSRRPSPGPGPSLDAA